MCESGVRIGQESCARLLERREQYRHSGLGSRKPGIREDKSLPGSDWNRRYTIYDRAGIALRNGSLQTLSEACECSGCTARARFEYRIEVANREPASRS